MFFWMGKIKIKNQTNIKNGKQKENRNTHDRSELCAFPFLKSS